MGRRSLSVLAIVAASAVAIGGCVKPPPPPAPPHCVTPAGVDLNEAYGVEERLVNPVCTEVAVGERWRAIGRWIVNTTHAVVPGGYTPAGATPADDFEAKFFGVKYVVDAGTDGEQAYTFTEAELARFNTPVTEPDGVGLGWASPPLEPLPAGSHTVAVFVLMTADHWDGYAEVPAENELPAGQTFLIQHTFEVVG